MITVSTEDFDEKVIKDTTLVVVDFFTEWCQPCRMISITLNKLSTMYSGRVKFAKINAEDEPSITSSLGINALPTIVIFKNGKVVETLVGSQNEKNIKSSIEKHL